MSAEYQQVGAAIAEELAVAESLQRSLEGERPIPGARGGLFLMPATERLILWRPLVSRLGRGADRAEVAALWREYEWARALQTRLPRRIAVYQLAFLSAVALFAVAPFEVEAEELQHLSDILPYLLASFWGIVGGCASSLWQLLRQVEERTLSASSGMSHLLRPYLGGILGLLISLLLPSALLDIEGADINLTGYALAALAGLSERAFITKLQQLLEVLLGQAGSSRAPVLTQGAVVAEPTALAPQPVATVASAQLAPDEASTFATQTILRPAAVGAEPAPALSRSTP